MVQPGCGPPFLTPKEFERKFGVSPRIRTDEELTRNYDSVGMYFGLRVTSCVHFRRTNQIITACALEHQIGFLSILLQGNNTTSNSITLNTL